MGSEYKQTLLQQEMDGKDCKRRHDETQNYHYTLLTYTNFNKLLRHLENSIYAHSNAETLAIEFPSATMLDLLLTVTSLGPECTANLDKLDDKDYGLRPLSLRSLDLIHHYVQATQTDYGTTEFEDDQLAELTGGSDWTRKKRAKTVNLKFDTKVLNESLFSMFSFIGKKSHDIGSYIKADKVAYEEINSESESEVDNTIELNYAHASQIKTTSEIFNTNSDTSFLNEDRILDNLKFSKRDIKIWTYYKWAFKCSAALRRSKKYARSWKYWRAMLHLITRFLLDDFEQHYRSTTKELRQKILQKSIFGKLDDLRYVNILDTAFTEADAILDPIFDSELKIMPTYIPLIEIDENEFSDSILGIESIQLRKALLLMEYGYLKTYNRSHFDLFRKDVTKKLMRLSYSDVLEFFTNYDTVSAKREQNFLLELARMMLAQLLEDSGDLVLSDQFSSPTSIKNLKKSMTIPTIILAVLSDAIPDYSQGYEKYRKDHKLFDLLVNFFISVWGETKLKSVYLSGMLNIIASAKQGEYKRYKVYRKHFPESPGDFPADEKLSQLLETKESMVSSREEI